MITILNTDSDFINGENNVVFDSFYWKVEETSQIIWVQMKSNIPSIHVFTDALALIDALQRQR